MIRSRDWFMDLRIKEQEEDPSVWPSHLIDDLDYGKTKKNTSRVKGSKKSIQ